jgi:hypothetical protein
MTVELQDMRWGPSPFRSTAACEARLRRFMFVNQRSVAGCTIWNSALSTGTLIGFA